MTLLFSEFLSKEQLNRVNYYAYFPVLESPDDKDVTCRILPSDDAVSYILEFQEGSRRIIKGELNWFNEPLYKNLNAENILADDKVEYHFLPATKDRCIVINLVDFCYGHSFVKLLNIIDFYTKYSDNHDLVIISFGYVHDFLPSGKFNIVNVKLSFSETQKTPSFKAIINHIKSRYSFVDFASLDAYKRFADRKEVVSFFNFFGTNPDPYLGKRFVTFNYRKGLDRSWAGNKQGDHVTAWFEYLRPYFSMETNFCVIGEKDGFVFPDWVMDKRISKFPNPIIHEYHFILKNSVLTVGLIGSHMLSATLLSDMTIHLTPQTFLRVAATDVVNHETFSSTAFFEHTYLTGRSLMQDYTPKRLAYECMLLYVGKISLEYKENCLQILKEKGSVMRQREYLEQKHAYFIYNKFLEWKEKQDRRHYRSIRIKGIMNKFKLKRI